MRFRHVAGPLAATFILLAAAPDWARAQDETGSEIASLRPGGFHEECMELEAGQAIAYRFSSSTPLAFNIHYHRGNEVLYLEEQDATDGGEGTVTAPSAENYCLMWENRTPEVVELRYRAGLAE